ncbi:MAG: hypothetical protein V4508_07190 [Pseudomonadota bacterium]
MNPPSPRARATPRPDARRNLVLADTIAVGVIYWEIFGPVAAHNYLLMAGLNRRMVERILAGTRR